MADTNAATGLTPQVWDDQFFMEYVRANRFRPYMGTDENSIIQVKEDLTKKKGDKITFAAVRQLNGAGVTGSTVLEGAEEDLDSRSMTVTVNTLRNAVIVTDEEEAQSAIGLRQAGKMALKLWSLDKFRDDIITGLGSINGVAYASASEAQKDAWLVDNADRVLFGAAKSNASSNDHSTSLANIDNTNDKLTPAAVSLMKRIAQSASPAIRPYRLGEEGTDEEWFVLFANQLAFRDFAVNSTVTSAHQYALERGIKNKLFTGGALLWDGVIIREIPEIAIVTGVGAGAIDVGPVYFCGAQAVGVGWAKRTKSTTDVRDYGFRQGVGIEERRGIEKLNFGTGVTDTADLKQHGMVTGWFAAVADA